MATKQRTYSYCCITETQIIKEGKQEENRDASASIWNNGVFPKSRKEHRGEFC